MKWIHGYCRSSIRVRGFFEVLREAEDCGGDTTQNHRLF